VLVSCVQIAEETPRDPYNGGCDGEEIFSVRNRLIQIYTHAIEKRKKINYFRAAKYHGNDGEKSFN